MFEAYEILKKERIEDVHADGMLLRHKKSGARIALLSCPDENKVFTVGFRTPPVNSTGVAHIIEHTVLCGSRKFPLKDPFVELAKGSLNTFLNAMTYPDKTIYPVASCNETDFQNLMDVYLDAAFHPNIYKNEKIFRQEGWHYEMEDQDSPLTINGVVYNEMKGAFSTPEEVLDRTIFNCLFPDTPYGVESGGDPDVIPQLTYEEFLDFHRRYYHPSNSYIYLYGSMDMEKKLDWLDREYLSHYEQIDPASGIAVQKPFSRPVFLELEYPVLDDEPLEGNTYLACSTVTASSSEVMENVAFAVLEYVLLDAPGAPVRQALLDAHIGTDIEGSYNDGIRQPFFSVVARNAEPDDLGRFLQVIRETLAEQVKNGIDRKALASGINYFEFRFREADYSSYPKGLIYGINMFDSWLYDENEPFSYLKELAVFDKLKDLAGKGWFEELIQSRLLDNPHRAAVVLRPRRGLAAAREQALQEKLAARRASLSPEEISGLVKETAELKAYQMEEDSEEILWCLPVLKRSDIARKTPLKLCTEEMTADGIPLLEHTYQTNGIGYLTLLFDTEHVPDRLTEYLGLLKGVLGMVSTEHYSYGQLFHEINANTGGITCGLQTFAAEKGENPDAGKRMFSLRAKYLYPKQEFVFSMIREILLTSNLDDGKRLYEILASARAGLQQSIPAAGHLSAVRRALSRQSALSAWTERTAGITFYRFIEELEQNFEEKKAEISANLRELVHIVFRPENLTVSLTAEKEAFGNIRQDVAGLSEVLYKDPAESGSMEWQAGTGKEGFFTSGQVQYVALTGNYRESGIAYTGAFRILRVLLNYDYLWMNLRVLGGAYGCMSAFRRSGSSYLVSYRDPHLKRTLDIYQGLPQYLRDFQADEETMTKYIIGAVSDLDTPMNASAQGDFALAAWFAGLTEQDFQKEREELLDATDEDIRKLAEAAEAIVNSGNLCVIGSESVLTRDADAMQTTEPLSGRKG